MAICPPVAMLGHGWERPSSPRSGPATPVRRLPAHLLLWGSSAWLLCSRERLGLMGQQDL